MQNQHLPMFPLVGIFVTCFFWIPVLGQDEILINGLPENCGNRPPLQPPPGGYTGAKTEAKENDWPWHVGLYASVYGSYPFCGGTLISPTWVLTAAHCIQMALRCYPVPFGQPFSYEKVSPHTLMVLIGGHNWTDDRTPRYFFGIKHIIMHPDFPDYHDKIGFDFALLKLKRAVIRSKQMSFTCLPKSGFKINMGSTCFFAGWGLIPNPPNKPFEIQPQVLMEKPGTIVDMSKCKKAHPEILKHNHVCVKQKFGTPCNGDSGGALNCAKNDGTWILYGIAAYIDSNCKKKYFASVSTDSVLTWIKETIQKYN
uniref:Chymotrypsin-like elastase family member 3B n=1 Tax=Schistocephalus solidus TaxID=70667 RepID=A0A0X3Q0P0_SCHSO